MSSPAPQLRLVRDASIDVTARLRGDIMARDWAACHIAATGTPGALKSLVISCDRIGCDVHLDDKQIHAAGGLREMGWRLAVLNGRVHHYCPDHK